MVNRAFVVFICLLLIPFHVWASLSTSVDRNPVLAGEFFNLTIRADKSVKGQQPDTSALLKDFVVGPTSVRSNTSIINGQVNHTTLWQVELMARNPGKYTIPSFTVANMQSSPVAIEVIAAHDNKQQTKDVYIETNIVSSELFVQQAGVYSVKLFLANDLTEGQLGSPELENANVSQLGKQKENYEIIDGVRYLVIERNYLIQPQKSGRYTIKSPYFKGRIRDNYRTRAASAIGKDIQLNIKPIPSNVTGNWLPSELVTLNEEWQPEKTQYQVGEPITRTITMTALGITKEQLPELNIPSIKGVRSYSDQADNTNMVRNGKVISQKVESFALMPQIPGTYTLPEVRVPWFNIITNRLEYATLPPHTLTIIGDPNSVTPDVRPVINKVSEDTPQTSSNSPPEIPGTLSHYYWLATVIGYFLWLLTSILLWRKYRLHKRPNSQQQTHTVEPKHTPMADLKDAAKQQNQRAFYHSLLKVSQLHTCSTDLNKLAHLIGSEEFDGQLNMLQGNLYAGKNNAVSLEVMLKLIEGLNLKSQKNNNLSSLY